MSNPWTKKNPLMSMWLSAANKAVGSARGQVAAATRREAAATQASLSKQVAEFWTVKPAKSTARKKTPR